MVFLDPESLSPKAKELLQSANLTVRVVHEQICTTTVEVLSRALDLDVPVVLLKGISIAEDLYAQPEHQTMSDIDILLPKDQAHALQAALWQSGYGIGRKGIEPRTPAGHHHLPPLYDPDTDVPVEIHTALFADAIFSREPLFRMSTLWDHTIASEFRGIPCRRLGIEMQLLYTVAHWAADQKWVLNVIGINDVLVMLHNQRKPIDWSKVDAQLGENPRTAEALAILLLFLRDTGLFEIPPLLATRVAESSRRLGTCNIKALLWLMKQFPFSGRQRVFGFVGRPEAQVVWITLLEPRHKSLRIPLAIVRVMWRRARTVLGALRRTVRRWFGVVPGGQ